jgi:hypothetical protein
MKAKSSETKSGGRNGWPNAEGKAKTWGQKDEDRRFFAPIFACRFVFGIGRTCAGKYEFAPDNLHWEPFTLAVSRRGDHLAGQVRVLAVHQGAFDIFPETETSFFLKVTKARLTFLKNGKGEVTAVNAQAPGLPLLEGKKLKN